MFRRSRSRSVSEILSVASASPQTAEPSDDEAPLLDLGLSVDQVSNSQAMSCHSVSCTWFLSLTCEMLTE